MDSPAFQFYPKDWLSSSKIDLMTPAEEGGYIRLICYCWKVNGLPDDDETLAKLSRLGEQWHKGSGDKIRTCFYRKGKKLFHRRLKKEADKQKAWREKCRQGGLKSAEIRRERKPSSKSNKIIYNPDENKYDGITDTMIKRWQTAYPDVAIRREIQASCNWLTANPKRRKKNVQRFIVNWLKRTQDNENRKSNKLFNSRNSTAGDNGDEGVSETIQI